MAIGNGSWWPPNSGRVAVEFIWATDGIEIVLIVKQSGIGRADR